MVEAYGGADPAELHAALARALETLSLAYQPIVRCSARAVFGYEALLRSREPALPDPGAVFSAAERLGRLFDVGRAVREHALDLFVDAPPETLLFVNLHARDLLDPELFFGGSPFALCASRIVLEITERASLHDVPDTRARIAQLRELGFRIALDDLGAGYAGLTSFALLEPDVVKLDMSLVRDLAREATKRTLVRTVASMCKDLNILVVAEGVETVEERDALLSLGCDCMQGNLFARPGMQIVEPKWG